MLDFETVENLSQELILNLYDEVIESDFISATICDVKCDNGHSGQALQPDTFSENKTVGYSNYKAWYNRAFAGTQICGEGQYGYIQIIANNVPDTDNWSAPFSGWYVKCDNGNSGYAIESGVASRTVGYTNYNRWSNASYAGVQICGAGNYGYIQLIANNNYNYYGR